MALPPGVQRALAGRPVVRDGQTLAVDTQLTLRLQRLARKPAVEQLPTIAEGRAALLDQAVLAGGTQPIGSVRELKVGHLLGRLYTPPAVGGGRGLLLFFHGGGFIYGDLDSHDAVCRFLAERAGVRVLAVDYRLAPEDPFPAAYDDAVAAHRWVVEHADELGVDTARLAVGGDSAGGNLAAGVAIEAARAGLPLAFQLLIYPCTDAVRETESAGLFGTGFFLTAEFMQLATDSYLGTGDLRDPRISPAYLDLPAGLAPAYVATAGFDPLRDEGEAYARQLEAAGCRVELQRFPDQIHGFVNVLTARTSRTATATIAERLRAAIG
jgi:acetyl esterase